MVTLTFLRENKSVYLALLVCALSLTPKAYADSIPTNLGCGLYDIVKDSQAAPAFQRSLIRKPTQGELVLKRAIKDAQGRIMVDIHLDGTKSIAQVLGLLGSQPGVTVVDVDLAFQAGTIEAYVTPAQAAPIAALPGVTSLSLVWKPQTNIGAVTTQGFIQHRVNKIAGQYDGTGIKLGVLSDSYDAYLQQGLQPDAQADIESGDLPGLYNPNGDTTPVIVLQDYNSGTDEGRAMLQIVHDLAPKAQLGFATAFSGYISFANNIRALKDVFGADVICDDVYYFAEPMFQDGPIAQAVDYVASKGAAYFSAAGNTPGVAAYEATFNPVPFDPANPQAALKGTNLNLTGVDPSLYAGGFHNFRTDGGQDIAQQCLATTSPLYSSLIDFQWNDPYAYTKQSIGKLLLSEKGRLESETSSITYPLPTQSANTLVRVEAGPLPAGSSVLFVSVLDPTGKVLFTAYSYQLPTEVALPAAGSYSVVVAPAGSPVGAFYVKVNQENVEPAPQITTNFNVLLFDPNGTFLVAFSGDALATKQPIVLQTFNYNFDFQLVIARSNIPTVPDPANRIRYQGIGFEPLNYGSYLSPATFGHNCAAGGNGVAAYSAFRPFAPEPYTSPGPTTIYFDADNEKLSTPEVRLKPDFAGMDGAYTTFFGSTTTQDASSFPNFFGTSAATPHVAGIAALVLQAHGGPGSVTPNQMRDVLQRSTFPHSLTPYYSKGQAQAGDRTVLIQANADYSDVGEINPEQFTVQMSGSGSIASLSINLKGADPTGGNIYKGYPGEVFTAPPATFGTGGYPFTVSNNSTGITNSDVKVSYSGQAPAPSITGEYYQLNLAFASGKLNEKATLQFGIGHLEHHSSYNALQNGSGGGDSSGGGAADLLGQGILLPSGKFVGPGATFTGVFDDGTPFIGSFTNQIGVGWTPLDGYGFIDAQKAVTTPLGK
jgi:hypothetical protein